MNNDMPEIGEFVAKVTVAAADPNECAIYDDPDDEDHARLVGRRKAQQFVFEHAVAGGLCFPKLVVTEKGDTGTIIFCWTLKHN